ncbi:MAG: hypothetical protein AAGF35_04500 [Pseudomonadota bacterium]
MKHIFLALIASLVFKIVGGTPALAADTAIQANPVEFRTCTYREGKDRLDLQPLMVKFRNYTKLRDVGYAAWLLTPELHSGPDFDFAWLGSWPDGVSYGVSMERWKTQGRSLAAEMDAVIDCGAMHEMSYAYPINAPDGTPEAGIILIFACHIDEGKTLQEAYVAQREFGQTMKANGSQSISWFYQPVAGAGPDAPDYYYVVGFYRYSDFGDTLDMFINRGGVALQQEVITPVSSCQTPDVYDAVSIRTHDETREALN